MGGHGSSVLPSPHSLKSQYASYSTSSRSFPNSPGFQPGVLALWWLWSPSSWWLWSPSSWWLWSPSSWCWLGTRIWSSSPSWWVGLPFRNGWPVWRVWWRKRLWWQLWRLWWWKRIWQGQQKLRQQGYGNSRYRRSIRGTPSYHTPTSPAHHTAHTYQPMSSYGVHQAYQPFVRYQPVRFSPAHQYSAGRFYTPRQRYGEMH